MIADAEQRSSPARPGPAATGTGILLQVPAAAERAERATGATAMGGDVRRTPYVAPQKASPIPENPSAPG